MHSARWKTWWKAVQFLPIELGGTNKYTQSKFGGREIWFYLPSLTTNHVPSKRNHVNFGNESTFQPSQKISYLEPQWPLVIEGLFLPKTAGRNSNQNSRGPIKGFNRYRFRPGHFPWTSFTSINPVTQSSLTSASREKWCWETLQMEVPGSLLNPRKAGPLDMKGEMIYPINTHVL